ncbi:MAG: hypothetical protein KDA72_16170 [Planctomycetales bacterium]|nr:hypothetical protein [Planctomycetales bacterium]
MGKTNFMTKLDQARCNAASTPASQLRSWLTIRLVLGLLATFGLSMLLPRAVVGQDFSPEHPKVKTMVAKGIAYLSSLPAPNISYEGGTELLIAYTIYKSTGDVEHPKVKAGLTLATKMARGLYQSAAGGETKIVYAVSLCALLLADADATKYRPELEMVLDWLLSVQKNHGGFGYLGNPGGDTSQVQYAMLAMWTMDKAGLPVPVEAVENTLRYLKSTVDPSGGWGYTGIVSRGNPVQQIGVSKSLATAGAGAVLIGCDTLGFFRATKLDNQRENEKDGIPAAFVRIDLRPERPNNPSGGSMKLGDLEGIIKAAERYHESHGFTGGYWYYYWRYSQERYESFREIQAGRQPKSPNWYNDGVLELSRFQEADGRWPQSAMADFYSDDICSCFAILYLIRSTQKAIGQLDEGIAFGGYGLPKDVSSIRHVGNRIVSDADASAQDLLKMLEQEDGLGGQLEWQLNQMQLSPDPVARREQVSRLARLLSHGTYTARRVAAKLLGRSEDLDQVPVLIDALSDEDPYVPQLAEESLRLLSRKLSHPRLEVASEPAQRKSAIEYWKKWYLGLRPDYVFIAR